MTREPSAAALSRRVDASAIPEGGARLRVETTEGERSALARLCGVPALDALAADLLIRREGDAGLRVTGSVTARLRRVCVVSLDEFPVDLEEAVDVAYAPEAELELALRARAGRAAAEDGEDDDVPDPIVNGRIDVGVLVAEAFSLGLDPYPRKPGVAFADSEPETAPDESPFAVLRRLGREG